MAEIIAPGAGAYNLQSISALRPKGLVHDTSPGPYSNID